MPHGSIPSPGDVFSVPISATEVAFGRVMLNIETQCIRPRRLQPDCPLALCRGTVLVEIYRETSAGELPQTRTILIPGLITSYGFIEDGLWKQLDHVAVDPREVAFPEALGAESFSTALLFQGEIKSPFDMSMEEVLRIDISPGSIAAITVGEIVLYHLGRKEEIKHPGLEDLEFRNLARYDLRFSPHRDRVYNLAGLDKEETYYERAKRMGFDLARMYE